MEYIEQRTDSHNIQIYTGKQSYYEMSLNRFYNDVNWVKSLIHIIRQVSLFSPSFDVFVKLSDNPSVTSFSVILPLQASNRYILLYHFSIAGNLPLHPSLSSSHYRHPSVSSFRSILPSHLYPSIPFHLSYYPI